jgi:hypothetical protein
MHGTGKFVTVIIFMVVMYWFVTGSSPLDILDLPRSGSGGIADISDISPQYIEECTSDGYKLHCRISENPNYVPKVEEDSYPSMIPEIHIPEFEWNDDHNSYLYSFIAVFIVSFVVLLLWKKSKPVIEMGRNEEDNC